MAVHHSYISKARIEAFSDGVFAITVTLLVLEIKIPEIHNHLSKQELLHTLQGLLPKVLSWIVSFLVVCVIWINHYRILEQLKTITQGLFWLNANLLLWCSFIPFPTALMGDYVNNPVALMTFGLILSLTSLGFVLIRFYVLKHLAVLEESIDIHYFKKATRRSIIFGPLLYITGAALSFIHPYLGFAIYLFIPVYFIFYNFAKQKTQE
jgi:uncharacterized membrane protein